jgi:tetratricopeptide (TPR) repeat protein
LPRDRLADLERMTERAPGKSLPWYALGMEQRARGDVAAALVSLQRSLQVDPDYVPAYFQTSLTLKDAGRTAEAVVMLDRGVEVARRTGDPHAAQQMTALAESLRGR